MIIFLKHGHGVTMRKNLKTAKKAFTLAEVLIIIAVPGTVFAMPMQTVKNIKNQQYC